MKIISYTLILSLAVAHVSCAGQPKKQTATTNEPVQEVEPTQVAAPAKSETSTFRALSYDKRAEFMKNLIVPRMTKVFQDFDAKHFAEFSCVTCHGPGANQGRFDMPTAALPQLDFARKDPKHDTWNAFMSSKVVPAMAGALGEQPFDPATKKGFGCLACHLEADK